MRWNTFSAIVFDFYGTLVDVDKDAPPLWKCLNAMGYESSEAIQRIWESDGFNGTETPAASDMPSYEFWRRGNLEQMARMSGVPLDEVHVVVDRLLNVDQSWTVHAVPGADEFLRELRAANVALGVCSNWDYPIERYILQAKLPQVDAIVTSREVGARKPHPRPFEAVAARLNTAVTSILFVGDSWECDIVGALRVGMTPVWIRGSSKSTVPGIKVISFPSLQAMYHSYREVQ